MYADSLSWQQLWCYWFHLCFSTATTHNILNENGWWEMVWSIFRASAHYINSLLHNLKLIRLPFQNDSRIHLLPSTKIINIVRRIVDWNIIMGTQSSSFGLSTDISKQLEYLEVQSTDSGSTGVVNRVPQSGWAVDHLFMVYQYTLKQDQIIQAQLLVIPLDSILKSAEEFTLKKNVILRLSQY